MGLRRNKINKKKKKGFMFTMDALFASIILITGLILISKFIVTEHPRESIEYTASDTLSVLSTLKMSDINASNSSIFNNLTSNNTNINLSVIEQLGTYWAANEISNATYLSDYLLHQLFPNNTGVSISMNGTIMFNNTPVTESHSYASDRMITGVMQGSPITGSTSSAYLRKISDKRTKSFAYFGGFVGQGNITVLIDIPDDVNSTDITSVILEVDAGANFSILINGYACANLNNSNSTMAPDKWDLSYCNSSFKPGFNNITLDFLGDINDAYIMGGYLRVDYKTNQIQQLLSNTERNYTFPEIKGIVNLFDSFYIPGNLTTLTVFLHYLADHTTYQNNTFYLTIGNTTVLIDTNSTTEQMITISNSALSAILNYSRLSGRTIPIRMGFDNLTYASQYVGNSKVMLVTDVSGSMDWEMSADSPGHDRNCGDASINNSDTSRLSVAKCLDKQFASDVLNISGNTLGLVSYDSSTNADTLPPTTNLSRINNVIGTANPMTGYATGGSTCICCGINSARDQLKNGLSRTFLVNASKSWKYNTSGFKGLPANDSSGNFWNSYSYNDSSWSSGNAILGHAYGGVTVTTELGAGNSSIGVAYANLWERFPGDTVGPPNDFSSGALNSSSNTFGIGGANDGWDWAAGAYGFDVANVDFNGASGGHLNLDFGTGNPARNRCAGYDCSGAYGISVNITNQMYQYLQSNGSALLSFYYGWHRNDNQFEDSDQVWIKSKWIRPDGTEYWLGKDLDAEMIGSDDTPEIYTVENPNLDFSGNTLIDLTDMITGPGIYYLHMGGKLLASANDEWGNVYIDNVQLMISNHTDHYYFRKHFNVTDINQVRRGVLNLLSDDFAKVYLNGNIIFDGQEKLNGSYWDRHGIFVDQKYFRAGDNVLAVDLSNLFIDNSARFDLQLIGINTSEQGAMLIMTDGQANIQCPSVGGQCDSGDTACIDAARNDAIQAACDAREDWGIQVFAVGYSTGADETTLQGIANCGEGIYAKSDNTSALSDFYNQVVLNIIAATIKSQTILVTGGNLSASNLYRDSHIDYTFTPVVQPYEPNEISVEMQTPQFNSCNPTIAIPSGIRIADAKITSYSAEHWSKTLIVDSNVVYNLSEFNPTYITLGDPYLIQVPVELLSAGNHTIYIDTGDNPQNSTGCSMNNSLIYTALAPSATSRSSVVEKKDGCKWNIQFEDNTFSNKSIPASYNGSNNCSYTAANHAFTINESRDAYDIAVYDLLTALDFDNNGKVFVNLDSEDIEIVITTVSSVPYLWGPSLVKARAWQ